MSFCLSFSKIPKVKTYLSDSSKYEIKTIIRLTFIIISLIDIKSRFSRLEIENSFSYNFPFTT